MEPSNPTPEPQHTITPETAAETRPTTDEPPIEQQTVREWVARNGSTLIIVAILIALMYKWLGLEGLGTASLVAIGLGMVIFIHELGHFMVAKWCDVHVETFSIGFGPPLPGCKFQRGETTYMIALFPLGGYVKMVGEGAENEEDDNDPRSFKNKAVWQRMAIISAGVFMNMVLGIGCFIFVYMAHGVERAPGVVGLVDSGSPAAQEGVKSGDVIYQIGDAKNPYFDQLMPVVALSRKDEQLKFIFGEPGQKKVDTEIEPRKSDEQPPRIGVAPPPSLNLLPVRAKKKNELPVKFGSAAADAKPALDWGDQIVAVSDPSKQGEVTALKDDPRYPEHPQPDYFEYLRRAEQLAGKEMKVRVRRAGANPQASAQEVEITIPPAYHSTLGLRMNMGHVMAIRKNSPASRAGVKAQEAKNDGDEIKWVTAIGADGEQTVWARPNDSDAPKGTKVNALDPMRLPWELAQLTPKQVKLTVLRMDPVEHKAKNVELTLDWDNSYRFDNEVPLGGSSPLAIPQLGLAYSVGTTVDGVLPGSPATKAVSEDGKTTIPLEKGDTIEAVCQYLAPEKGEPIRARTKPWWFFWREKNWTELKPGGWAIIGYNFSHLEVKQMDLRIKRGDEVFKVHIEGVDDKSWPMADRGLNLTPDFRMHKAENLGQAIDMGFSRAFRFIGQIYRQLEALATGRLPWKMVSGPIGIAATAYEFADYNIYMLVLFLGIISVNLAVVNFLPIPVLDGGHMVFLIYEGLRGKPASESVRIGATYVGLALIAFLMLFVICIDLGRYI